MSGILVYGNPDVESTRKPVGCLPVPGSGNAASVGNKAKKPADDRQESAEAIVAKRHRETCGQGEGPNIMEQGGVVRALVECL